MTEHPFSHAPRRAASGLIVAYQRHLSHRKGWHCAHAQVHGGASCSAAIRSLVEERGVARSVRPGIARFAACYAAATLAADAGVQGVCCCGPIPIPFRF